MRGAPLDLHVWPHLPRLLQPRVPIDHEQPRCGQPPPVEIAQDGVPQSGGFRHRHLQRHQPFLARFRDSEDREDGNRHDAPGEPHLEMEAVQEQDGIPLACELPLLPRRKQRLQPADHRETALFDRCAAPTTAGALCECVGCSRPPGNSAGSRHPPPASGAHSAAATCCETPTWCRPR